MMPVVDFRLYLITDRKLFGDEAALFGAVEEALQGGCRAVQLREKDLPIQEMLRLAYRFREMTAGYNARLFINDRVDVALAAGADGVHLGHGGMPVRGARKAGGMSMLIGYSTHGVDDAVSAEEDGADFITLGPVYETPSKIRYGPPLGTGVVMQAREKVKIPVFAIGGIKTEKIQEVKEAGADGIALISGILASKDPRKTTEECMRLLQ